MLRRANIFLFLSIILTIVLGTVIIVVPKHELHLALCQPHSPAADIFFRYYTQVGEWVPYLIAALLLFYKLGWTIFTLTSTLLTGLVTQILKHIVDAPRPLTWFATTYPDVQLPLVEGVRMSQYYSFPSGHTTTFFALMLTLAFISSEVCTRRYGQISAQVICFVLAALGGYSRIYLNQHFAADILGGIVIGIAITLVLSLLISSKANMQSTKLWNWNLKTVI